MMNGIAYFPGCSLKDTASEFEASARFVMEALKRPLQELQRWTCCGTVSSLTTDDLMHHLASVRTLVRVQDLGEDELVTLCAMCYNTLSRTAQRVNSRVEDRDKINRFMDRESDYEGRVTVKHLLQVLRDRIGWDALADAVTHPLEGLKVACYYGCTLVRPREAAIDDVERPTVMADALEAAGASPIGFPFATECCGAYQVVDRRDLSVERSIRVLRSAVRLGVDMIATACPLCQHNLQDAQREMTGQGLDSVRVLYFTELLAAAMGMETDRLPEAIRPRTQDAADAERAEGGVSHDR
jgi:heterodisulfide reductase subunit B2